MPERQVFILDSTTQSEEALHAGQIVVSGSHSGRNAVGYAIHAKVGALISNDAGFGRDNAGVSGLALLQTAGVIGATVAHTSAHIGNGQSTWDDGVISAVNALALSAGIKPGQTTREACEALAKQ